MRKTLIVALVLLGAVLAALQTIRSAPLAELPPPPISAWPHASPPADMAAFHLLTGLVHRNAAFAYRGGSFRDKRDFAVSAVLVKHPRGDLLIDTGFGRDIAAKFQLMPFWFRAVTQYTALSPASEQLARVGYDRSQLRAILLTHAHWDHASALEEFAGTPVWVTAEERKFIAEGGFAADVVRSARGVHYETYTFASGPYLSFARSHDVYGDGAIVIVPAPGHTPGSVIVFLNLPDARRYAFIGDLTWQLEAVAQREERPLFTRFSADLDVRSTRHELQRMAALARRFPELIIVPAHDRRAYSSLPAL